jgi:hypothetical protein
MFLERKREAELDEIYGIKREEYAGKILDF